ncbi:MAG TPA: glycoside hydrolase family 97 catalytic domain-containing protein [Chitinophagaceae bacterium]|nr:glycoside hydrolase family 97 catalytic domain-containing protein [Chitinophagaceae bacterium]
MKLILILFIGENAFSQQVVLSSPDKKISVSVFIQKDKKLYYKISANGIEVLRSSRLGIAREDEDFSAGMVWLNASAATTVRDNYSILTAKKSKISYTAIRRTIYLRSAGGKKMNIVFQVSDDGVAFRYEFPERSADVKKINSEITSFHFNDGTKAWLQPKTEAQSGWEHTNPSYEAHYMMDIPAGTPSPAKNGWVYPALFQYKNMWMLITEAALGRTYCGTALQQHSPNNEYSIGFPQPPEVFTNGILNPQSTLPWQTPWRIIAIGNLKTIAESTLGTDLAFPAKKMDTSFIKPGKASWSWIMKKDDSTIFSVQKKYIDYAADMKWQYCLIDVNWDTMIGYDSIKILSDYAALKNIGLLLWYNSAGDWNTVKYHPKDKLLTHESRIKEFAILQSMGIKGIKVDFFSGDGQSMINYYQDILEDAAAYHLLVNFHGATLPRGWHRTFPNLMTTEAVYGYEMITFNQKDADQEPAHAVMCAFARNAFDPMDFTPVCLYKIPRINRITTVAFELATSVIYLSGIQHYAESPEGMSHMPAYIQKFLQEIPVYWNDVKFIDGFPGKYIILARKSGKKWYIAGINGEGTSKKLSLDLSFAGNDWKGTFITDDKDDPGFKQEQIRHNKMPVEITMDANGGFVIVLEP